jgi:hypothetical protein
MYISIVSGSVTSMKQRVEVQEVKFDSFCNDRKKMLSLFNNTGHTVMNGQ